MKKVLIAAALLASTTMSFAQSNTPGTIHLGLGTGFLLGGAKIKTTFPSPYEDFSSDQKGVGVRGNYYLKGGYGLANAFSLHLFLRTESAAYVVTSDINSNSTSVSDNSTTVTKGFGIGLEPRVYMVNKDKFNLYAGLPIGFSSGNAYDLDDASEKTKISGLNYGLNVGFNWYWASFIGMSLDLGYGGVALSGKKKYDGLDGDVKTKISGGGLYFGIGLVSKFGGDK